ncbi:MAG: hypothetical protein N2484_01790 [Clostridia bacterium]|nr:hypothetical protein [Clostridia bacterium]
MDNHEINTKKCSFCGEDIRSDLRRCPYCGSLLEVKVDELKLEPADTPMSYPQFEAQNQNLGEKSEKTEGSLENVGQIPSEPVNVPVSNTIRYETIHADSSNSRTTRSANPNWMNVPERKPLSNGMKVFLTAICTIIPGLGQLIGIILSIVFMNSEEDPDRKSFGVALLVASLIIFVFSCLYCIVLVMALGAWQNG